MINDKWFNFKNTSNRCTPTYYTSKWSLECPAYSGETRKTVSPTAWERKRYIDSVSSIAAWLLTIRSCFLIFSEFYSISRGIISIFQIAHTLDIMKNGLILKVRVFILEDNSQQLPIALGYLLTVGNGVHFHTFRPDPWNMVSIMDKYQVSLNFIEIITHLKGNTVLRVSYHNYTILKNMAWRIGKLGKIQNRLEKGNHGN